MRKILLFLFVFILLCFLIPIIFSSKFKIKEAYSDKVFNEITEEIIQPFNYDDYKKIKLLHSKNNVIEEMNIDEYLYNVVSAEMPASYHEEALKAQAVVARTYTIYTMIKNKEKHGEADICDSSDCCQAWILKEERLSRWDENLKEEYWNKITNAVNSTTGEVITYNNEIINALYHANSGGITERAIYVWEGKDYPYLQMVETSRRERIQTI